MSRMRGGCEYGINDVRRRVRVMFMGCDSPTTVGEFVEVNVMLLTTAHGVRYDTLGLELVDLSWVNSTSRAITRVGRARADADSRPVLLALKAAVTLGTMHGDGARHHLHQQLGGQLD